jgi:hypothetical protein
MAPEQEAQSRSSESRGYLPRAGAGVGGAWRRARAWLFGRRDDIRQEGLLAERTLRLTPRRPRPDDAEVDARVTEHPVPDDTG